MSLPAETKFPCVADQQDKLCVNFMHGRVAFEIEFRSYVKALGKHMDVRCDRMIITDRAQVESLRDQLTEWLEVTK